MAGAVVEVRRATRRILTSVMVAMPIAACGIWPEPDPRCEAVPHPECQAAIEEALGSVSEENRDEAEVLWVRPTSVDTCNANDTPLYDAAVRFTPDGVGLITTLGHTPTGHLVVCTY